MAWIEQPTVFDNAEFETADKTQPWVPEDWTLSEQSTRWEYDAIDGYAAGGTERFESGWGIESLEEEYTGWRHKTPDRSDMSQFSVADQDACETTANAIKAIANLHFGDTDFHKSADGRTIASADATDLSSLLTLVNELVTDCQAHSDDPSATWHNYKSFGWDEPLVTTTATDLLSAQIALVGLIIGFGRHLWWRGNRAQWPSMTAFPAATADLPSGYVDDDGGHVEIGAFDASGDGHEDFEEEWESYYLDPGVQAQLGTNENVIPDLIPTIDVFDHGDAFEGFEAGWNWRHKVADGSDMDDQDVSSQAKAEDVANYVKGIANAHFASTAYHVIADPRTISSPDATDLASLILLVNEEYDDCKSHAEDAGLAWHRLATDGLDVPITVDVATDLGSAQIRLAVVVMAFGRHLWWKGNDYQWPQLNGIDLSDIDGSAAYVMPGEFDAAGDDYEDFEEEWGGNEDVIASFVVPTNLSLGTFYGGSSFDSFETSRTFVNEPTSAGTYSDELDIGPDKEFLFWTSGTWVATFELQAQRSVGGPWITLLEFTSNVTDAEFPEGYRNARIYCSALTSSGLSGYIRWGKMDIY